MVDSRSAQQDGIETQIDIYPKLVIWRALRRYNTRQLTQEIWEKDFWLFEIALKQRLSSYSWPMLMHTPATLRRIARLLEDFGAERETSSAHARIVVLIFLLAGIRPANELVIMHRLADHMANICQVPDASLDRAMFITLYPRACSYILKEFDNVLFEIRQAAALGAPKLATGLPKTPDFDTQHRQLRRLPNTELPKIAKSRNGFKITTIQLPNIRRLVQANPVLYTCVCFLIQCLSRLQILFINA